MPDSAKLQQDQILQCYKQMDDIFHAYAVEKQLSDSAFWILYTLCGAEKPYTQNDFCEEWYYTKQTIHSAVAGLISAGYVRLEHIQGSRNSKEVALTEAGRAYVEAHIRPLLDAEYAAFLRLGGAERDEYVRLVKKHLSLFSEAVGALKVKTKPPAG